MSILIKGMEMPTSPVLFCIHPDGKVFADLEGGWREYQSVPVPPHGRLIDGDYLKHTHCAECTLYPDKCLEKTGDGCDWGSIMHLRMCPTIIPAEEGEK